MSKYAFLFIIIFFLLDSNPAFSQESSDTVETMLINPHSLYRLKARSGFIAADSIRTVDSIRYRSYILNPDYAYANDPDYWKKAPAYKPGIFSMALNSPNLKWILLIIAIGLAVFGLYQLARENNFSFLTKDSKQNGKTSGEPAGDIRMDYESAIRQFQEDGDFRMAIRYMYLRLMRNVKEKGGIPFRASSTNAEMVRAFGSHPLAGDFRFLATAYEYVYYGSFIPKPEMFLAIKDKFDAFKMTPLT